MIISINRSHHSVCPLTALTIAAGVHRHRHLEHGLCQARNLIWCFALCKEGLNRWKRVMIPLSFGGRDLSRWVLVGAYTGCQMQTAELVGLLIALLTGVRAGVREKPAYEMHKWMQSASQAKLWVGKPTLARSSTRNAPI